MSKELEEFTTMFEAAKAKRDQALAEQRAQSVNGALWYEAKMPSRFHRCYAHTSGWVGLEEVQRCACGAIRNTRFRGWLERNSRRKERSNA